MYGQSLTSQVKSYRHDFQPRSVIDSSVIDGRFC